MAISAVQKVVTGAVQKVVQSVVNRNFPFDIYDTFTAPDNTSINLHTADTGESWVLTVPDVGTPLADQVKIVGGELSFLAGAEGAVLDAGTPEVDIRCKYKGGIGSRSGVLMRSVSNGNTLSFRLRQADGAIDLLSWTAGVSTSQATALFTFTAGQYYNLRVTCEGNVVTAYIDDVQVLQATITAHNTGTRHGFTSYGSDFLDRYDDLGINKL